MDHLKLLCDIGELNWIFSDSTSTRAFLQRIVGIVATHMQADVCSVYLFDDARCELILKATKGLHPDSVERVKLKLGEGLVGLAVEELRPVCEPVASTNPHFKFFPGIFEEQYESFLVVPILRGEARIGALTVQRKKDFPFGDQDVMALRAVASQLANIIENARLLLSLQERHETAEPVDALRDLRFIKGRVASEGFAVAEAVVVDKERFLGQVLSLDVDRAYTMADFHRAAALTENQLRKVQSILEEKLSEDASLIFTSHLLILRDRSFFGAITDLVEAGESPPTAILKVAKHFIDLFSQAENAYIREKAQDLKDLTLRLLGNLVAAKDDGSIWHARIVVARDLYPSDLLQMSSEGVAGLVLVGGGVTSHLSILARSLRIPLVIVDAPRLLSVPEKTVVLLDAEMGNVFVNPHPNLVSNFRATHLARVTVQAQKKSIQPFTLTGDGTRIRLLANINLLADLKAAREIQAEGIGLYRTELPFIVRSTFPSEEEQYAVYRRLVEGMPGRPLTFRTLDLGGDKVPSYWYHAAEHNPFLGLRSIRFCLQNRAVFADQLRAILRAGANAEVNIMFPMVSSIEEFLEARAALFACRDELREQGVPHHQDPRVGLMIEIPSVVDLIEDFAREADFFSIGTNDLIQYTLAVDRTNEKVANLYVPHHPAVLRTMKRVVDAAQRKGTEVSVCGEMASDEKYLPFFLGIGVRTLSLDPIYIPRVQKAIASIHLEDAARVAHEALGESRVEAIARILEEYQRATHREDGRAIASR
ncbi:MAG TPA: phosphoenolpyruvate--protein phosphotransferase [Syntrophobacteria bacterium]|nr:phosphoenolpyruvate--protein phosphotransferase [Syntrophobacteria bacterium]